MKRVGVPRLAAAADEASLITATTIQQQSGGTSMHTLTQQAQQPIIGAAAMLAVGGQQNASGISSQFVRAPSRPQQQQVGVGGGPAVINYSKAGGVQYAVPPKQQAQPALVPRHKQLVGNQSPGGGGVQVSISSGGGTGGPQFQRLKVEDALSYLDQVKYKFNNQPQVYNDFLDIMKEFKSQSIDTPGVITRVSNLFKGHPELIVGFNTFLPPGYKIEVQANGQGSAAKNGTLIVSGIAYQVSVSMPSPTGLGGTQHGLAGAGGPPPAALLQTHSASQQQQQQQLVHIVPVPSSVSGGGMVHNLSVGPVAAASNTLHHISQAHQQIEAAAAAAASHHGPGMGCSAQVGHAAPTAPPPPPGGQPVEFNHAIEYVNKIKSRFSRQPDKYKRFLEILHAYQRGQRDLKEPLVKQQTEQEVYAQVAKLFENQDDLLAEFGQFLPDASGKGGGALGAPVVRAASPPAPPAPPPAPAPPPSGGKYGQERQQERQQMGAGAQIAHHHQRSSLDGLPGSGNAVQGDQTNASETYSSSLYRTPPLSPPPATHHHQQQISTHQTLPKLGSAPIQQQQHHHLKRSPSFTSATNQLAGGGVVGPPPPKKARPVCPSAVLVRDVSYAEAAKYGTLADFGFFDKVRKALRSQDVYDNFLRCLLLFTNEIISKSELLTVTAPFLSRHRELQRWLQEFLGPPASPPPAASAPSVPLAGVGRGTERAGSGETAPAWGAAASGTPSSGGALSSNSLGYGTAPYASTLTYGGGERYTGETRGLRFESLGALGAQLRHDRPQGDAAMDVDLSTCKRLGTSYCALPRGGQDAAARRCSGRTPLCRDVLNDTWVSFPTWSEDSTFVTCRKTQYEEYMYRCEDERFELDVVIETNASTIRVLEGVHKKLSRMGAEEAARFRLDDCLGGSSATIHQRALRRIYGDKVATDIIAGLKKNPVVAVPVVLRRLKAKEEEWREAQKGFNKQWREQNEKYYLKSLDHQGINFKQNDLKALRSKSLFNDIETAYEERRGSSRPGPDLSVEYGVACGPDVLRDAAELLIHHVRRQTAIQKAEKRRIKQLLRQFVPDLFGHPRQPLSDDERDDDDKEGDLCGGGSSSPGSPGGDDMPVGNQVKQEKNEVSSESDTNNSERGGGRASTRSHHDNHKNNNNNAGIGDVTHNAKDSSLHSGNTRRSSGGVDGSIKTEPLGEPTTPDDGDTKDTKEHIVAEGGARTFVCTTSWYLFLRLHGVLCARLAGARRAAAAAAAQEERDARLRRPSTAVALKLKPSNVVSASEYYTTLLELVRGVLDGNVEACALEDAAREMLGIRAYPVYTLDKVVSSAVRQLQHCVSERASVRCAELASRGGDPATYRRRAHRQLRDQQAVFLVQVYGGEECRVTFELVEGRDGGRSASPPAANMTPSHQSRGSSGVSRLAEWSRYNDSYACPTTPTDSASNTPAHRPSYYEGLSWCGRRALFLRRNRIAVAGAARFANGARTPPSPAAARAPDAPAAGHARRKPAAPRAAHARSADGAPRCDKCGTVCGGGTQDVGGALQVTPCRLMHAYKSDYFEFKRCRRTARKGGAATRQMQAKVTSAMSARWRRWLRAWAEQHIPPNARDKLLMPGVNNSICGVSSSHGPPECATDR